MSVVIRIDHPNVGTQVYPFGRGGSDIGAETVPVITGKFENAFILGVAEKESIGCVLASSCNIKGVFLECCVSCCFLVPVGSRAYPCDEISVIAVLNSKLVVVKIHVCSGISC